MAEDLKKLVERGVSKGYSLEKIQSDFANAGWGEAYLNNIPVYYNEFKKKSPVGARDAGVLPSRQGDTRFSSESQLQQDKYAGVGNIPLSDPLLKKKDGLADSLFKILNQAEKDTDNANKYVPQIQKLWNDYSSIERGQKETQNIFDERGRINRLALSSLNASAKRNSDRVKEEAKAIAKDDGIFETAARGFYGGILGAADYVANLFDPDTYDDQPDAPDSLGLEAKRQLERAQKASLGRKLSAGYTEKQIEDGFIGNFTNGNYGAAFDLFGRDLVEVLPQNAVGFIPYVGLPLMAASAGGQGWQAVKDDDKYSTLEKFIYAPLVGTAEYVTEKLFGMDRRMVQKGLSEAFGKTIKSGADIPKKELGDMLFGGIPKAVRAPLEEGLEEGIVSTFTQTLDKIMAGKPFDPVEIAESVMLGAGAGGSTYALVRGGSALLQTPVFNDVYTITNNVNKINELLKSEDIVPEEKEILSNRLNQFKTQLNQLRNEASDYYKPFSQEDKQRTLELNQAITKGMRTYGAMKTPEAKAEVVNTIRQSLAEKAQIEQKYDSTQKQQVPSPVVQGAQPGGVPIQGTSAEAPQAGGVLQVPSQQEEEIVKKTREVEASTPSASVKPVSTTLNENNYQGIIGSVRQYVDNLSDNLFETLGTSRQQVMNGVDSIANVLSSFAKSNRQIPITIYATEEAWKRGTGEQDVSRGIYVEGKVEGQPTKISIFLPALVGNTVYHEGLHDVVPKVFGVEGINKVSKALSEAILQDATLASSLGNFASNYKKGQRAEEFLVELASRVSSGDIDIEVTKSLATRFMEAIAKVLGVAGIKMNPSSAQLSKALVEYAQRLGAGVALEEKPFDVKSEKKESPFFGNRFQEYVSEVRKRKGLDDTQEVEDDESVSRQALGIRRKEESLIEFGLPTNKKPNNREVGQALELRQRKKYKKIKPNDFSDKSADIISDYMVDEVIFEVESLGKNSAVGWYGPRFQEALDELARVMPSMRNQSDRNLFTMLVAITSDGQKVENNFTYALSLYNSYVKNGVVSQEFSFGGERNASMKSNVQEINRLLKQNGGDLTNINDILLERMRYGDIKKKYGVKDNLIEEGTKKTNKSDYKVDTMMPVSAGVFGPKLGAFYANLSGQEEYLTMDRWWSRTFNRYRGTLLPTIKEKGLDRFKLLAGLSPTAKKSTILKEVTKYANAYKKKKFKDGTEIEKAANTIYKAAFTELNDSPNNAGDREFMIKTASMAKDKLSKAGYDLTLADVQAVLWYFEKRLYAEIKNTKFAMDIDYSDAMRKIVSDDKKLKALPNQISKAGKAEIESEQEMVDVIDSPTNNLIQLDEVVDLEAVNNATETINKAQERPSPRKVMRMALEGYNEKPQAMAGQRLFNEPLKEAADIADKYYEKEFNEARPKFNGVKSVDKERAKRISDAYIKMEDNYFDPEVKKAYDAMIDETLKQFDFIVDRGYKVVINNKEPYKNSEDMITDLRDNKVMRIFSTESGFGDEPITENQRDANPLLKDSGRKDANGIPLLNNDLFRFVHDFFGHAELGNGFGAVGEENAWNVHSRMYSPLARKAMTSETRGQNSYVNFSGVNEDVFKIRDKAREERKKGNDAEADRLLDEVQKKMKFADQKVGLLPEEMTIPDEFQDKKSNVKRMALTDTFKNASAPNFITEEDRREFQSMSLSDTQDEANDELWSFVQRRNLNEEQIEEVLQSGLWDEVSDSVRQNEERIEEEAYYEKNPHEKQLEDFSNKMEAYGGFDFTIERAGTGTSYVTVFKLSFDKNGRRSKEDVAQIRFANHMRAYNPKNPNIANYDIGPDYNTTVDGVIKKIVGDAKPKAKQQEAPTKKAMLQIIGENAELAQDVRANLRVARNMEMANEDAKTIRMATGWERGKDNKWRYEVKDLEFKKKIGRFEEDLNQVIRSAKNGNVEQYDLEQLIDSNLFDFYPSLKNTSVILSKRVVVGFQNVLGGVDASYYKEGKRGIIAIKAKEDLTIEKLRLILVHEIQHAIQDIEGFAEGNYGVSMQEEIAAEKEINLLDNKIGVSTQILRDGNDSFLSENINELSDIEKAAYKDILDYSKSASMPILDAAKVKDRIWKKDKATQQDILKQNERYVKTAGEVEARNVETRIKLTPEQRRAITLQETEDVARDEQITLFDAKPKAKRMAIVPSESMETPSQIDARAGELLLDLFKGTKYFDRVKSIKRQLIIDPESRKKYEKALGEKDGRALYGILGNQDSEKAIAFAKEKFPIKGSLAAMADRVYLPTDSEEVLNFGSTVIYSEYQKYLNKELKDIVNESTLDPKDLLREVGYELFNPKNLTEARESFLHFYENGKNICTLNIDSNRFRDSFVTFIVKDDAAITPMADKLTQDNLTKDWKDYLEKKGRKNADGTYNLNGIGRDSLDPYSTSVVSLQINKSNGVVKEISRYNHQIGSPDNIFSRDFNKIIDGLEDAMFKKFGVNKNINQSRKKIPYGIIQDADGRFFNYISEKNGVYYGDGFYLEGGVATRLDNGSQRMVDGFVINANGKVEDVINSGKPFFYGDVLKVNYIKGNEISLKTVNGDFVFEVTNGAVSNLINFPKAWVEKELDKISSYTYDSEGGIIITYTRFSDDFLERINMLWSDDIVGFNTSMDFSNTKIQSLGKLKYITGNANFSRSNIQSLGELMYIGGAAWFSKSKVQSLGELRYVGSMATFLESQIQSLGKLRYVGSDIEFAGSIVKSLGELRFVAGYASFFEAQVQSLGKLRYVGSAIDTYDVQSLGELRYVGTTASFPQIQDKSFEELRYVGGYIHLGNLNRIESIGNLSHVGRKTLYSSAPNNIQEEINNLVDSRKSIGYGLIGKEEYARVRAEYHQISKKTEELVRGLNQGFEPNSSSTIEKAILEIDEIGDAKPKVKLQKISKAQGSQLEAQMYGYLLSISQKQPDNTYKLPFTLDDFLSFMSPTFSRQRATEIYENVSKGVIPEKVVKSVPSIDDAYDASKKLLDSQKNKKMFTWDAARKFFLDRQATLKAAILKAGMKNAYNLLVNRAGSGARANYFFSKQEKAIYDGLSSKDIEALDKIIMLRRIAEIDKNFDVRGEKRPIHPNKLNFESAQIGLAEKRKELGDAKFNELNDRANQYFDAFKSLLDSMYDEGLINEDLYNRLKNLDYQPRMFIEHVFDMDELSMRDINLSANQVKRIKDGSEDEIMFDSRFLLAVYSKSTFSRIARNKVNRAIAEATSVKGNEEWISKDPKKQFSEVTYFEDGVRKQFYIKSSLKGELDDVQRFGAIPPESQKYVGLLSGSYLLKLLATRANPLFVFRNIPRDYLHVLFFTNVYDNMNMPLAMYRLAGDAIKGVKGKIKDDQDYKDFIEYGGGMEYLSTEGKEGMMTNRSLLNRTIEKLGSAGELSEIAFRLGMYKRLVQESLKNFNGTPTEEQLAQIKVEAVTKSREMIDFAQGGVATKTLESAVPYINAAFQGFRVSSAYIKNNPKEFVIKLGQLAIGLAVIAMYNAVMGDDDMEDIPEDVKRKYFIIMTPFTEEKDGKTVRKYIKIAKTQQLIPFISSLDMSLEGNLIAPFMGREPRFNEDTIKQSWDAFLSYFPKDPTKPLDEALSSVPLFSALAAYKMNYDTYRKRIVSTDYQDKNVLPAYEDFSDKNVPYFYKAIGQAVVGGAGPKRLQVATEKFITTPYSSLITMGGYTLMDAIASNVYEVKGPGGYTPAEQEAISNKALKSAGINVEKIFIGTTDPDHKIYNKREQIERINLEASTERRGLKLQAKELGGKYFTAREQGDTKGMNEALEAIRKARIEARDKAVKDKNKQDYDYFSDALKTNMRFGPTFPQEYNDITFATDNEARAKIIAIRDMNMTQKELIDYLVDYKRKTGKSIDIRTIIREYDKFVTNEKK